MRRTAVTAAAMALVLAAPAGAQAPSPAPTPAPVPPPASRQPDPLQPQKAEQEPRPAEQERAKQASQGGAADPAADAGAADDDGDKDKAKKPKWDVSNPPGPGRDVPIDVRQGTWLSVDVSPDGREVAFDLLGDIYVIPIAGGEARNLTRGGAWDMQPRYSPNGRWIAFTSDRGGGDNIWIMDRDGSNPRQVTKETFRLLNQADWTPDSQFLVARKHFTSARSLGAGEMWLYHRSGGDGVQLTKKRTDQKDTNEPAFSPDGRYLYFSDDATPGEVFEYSKDVNGQIYVIQRLDRETNEIKPYVTGPGGSIRPTPSPDGKSLAFIRRVRYKSVLYVKDLESGRETPIYDGLDRDMQETWAVHGVYPGMSWTPDGKAIVLWAGGEIRRVDVAARSVAAIPFHVKDTRRVQEAVRFPQAVAPDRFDVKMLRGAKVSPDGRRVVYEALGKLWLKDLAGAAAPRRLTRQEDSFELYPAWSRDGRSIAYVTWSDSAFGSVRVAPAAGGEGRAVTDRPGHYVEPVFSPDGSQIAYRRITGGGLRSALWSGDPGLYVVPAAGGASRKVTDKGALPQFGARGDRVFFMTFEKENKRALRSVELDGSDERTHLTAGKATEFALSPDERWLAWAEGYNAYVAPFVRQSQALELNADGKGLPQARVSRDAGEWLHWSGDSRALHWSLGPQVFTRPVNQTFAFEEGAPASLAKTPAKPEATGTPVGFTAAYDKPAGRIALTGARIVTLRGDEVIEDGVVVINANRIEAVGPRASTPTPAGAQVIDVAGKTIIPGLIDAHWHGPMGGSEIIPQQSWIDYASLAFGVTTIHDPSNDTSEVFAHSELAKAGLVTAPRIFSTGTILYGATTPYTAKVDSLEDALTHLRRLKAVGAFTVKSYNQPRREQRQQIIEAARQTQMMVVPEGGSLFEHNMTMVADGHTTVEHSLPVAKVYDDVVQFWRQAGTAYNPTLVVAYGGAYGEIYWYQHTDVWKEPRLAQFTPRRQLDARSRRREMLPDEEWNVLDIARQTKQLADVGVPVLNGAHGQREGLGTHWNIWTEVLGGMTPLEALRTATTAPAKALGLDRDLGSIEPGKLADLVVLDGNPLADIRNSTSLRFTVLNGRVYDTRLDEVAPRKRPRAPFFFERPGEETTAPGAGGGDTSHAEDLD